MADGSTGLIVKSLATETVRSKLVDTGGTNEASISAGGAVKVDGSAVTQPVSGTVAVGASVVPGTAATNLGKAEDAAHASGDTGVFVLAVRNDAGGALANADGDYIPFTTDNTGALRVTGGSAGTQYVGDAAATATPTGTIAMGLANAAAPTDVSANNDAVAQWMLRNGSAVMNLASGGTLITIGQKTAANGLPVTLASDQATLAAPLGIRISDGSVALIGQKAMSASLPVTIASDQSSITVSNSSALVDNAGFTDGTTPVTMTGYIFDDVAGTALTENDAAAARIDSKRAQVFVGEDATTRGQKWAVSAAGALSSNITQVGGSTISATVPLPSRLTDGTAFYTKTGQTAGTAAFAQLSDQTTAVNVIAGTNALKTDISSVAGTATVTGGVAGSQGIGGLAASGATISGNPVLTGGTFTTTQPTVTTGQAVNLQTSNRGALLIATGVDTPAFNLTQIGGATQSATNPLSIRLADGTAFYSLTGQTAATGSYTRITDATNTAAVIATVNSLKTDLSSVAGAVPSATNAVPVRLTDGAAFYAAASGAPTSPQFSTVTSASLGAGSAVDLNSSVILNGTTGQLIGMDVSSAVPLKLEIKTVNSGGSATTRIVLFTPTHTNILWRSPYKTFITQAGAATNAVFRATVTNRDASTASDVYATIYWDQV